MGDLTIERVFEPSAIRRGRMATSPVFFVNTPGWRWRFPRKRDAKAFVDAGGVCPNHVERFGCPHCIGSRVSVPTGGTE